MWTGDWFSSDYTAVGVLPLPLPPPPPKKTRLNGSVVFCCTTATKHLADFPKQVPVSNPFLKLEGERPTT